MKLLSGTELAEYIKARQAKQVRGLRQADHVFPRLAIIQTEGNAVIETYVRLKKAYGLDVLVDVDVYTVKQSEIEEILTTLNTDESVHGIIVQLPLSDPTQTDEIVSLIDPLKDVDALGPDAKRDAATPMAISWLLAGFGVELKGKTIVIVGEGRLVGKPLATLWRNSGLDPIVVAEPTDQLGNIVRTADIVVTAAGVPGLITSDMLKLEAVVVDAGTASEGGKIVGDVSDEVYERHDLTITPVRGGVGPLTVCALFDNVIRAARETVTN